MSVAALEAIQLHHAVAAGRNDDLAQRFSQRAKTVVDDAWMLAVGSDFQFEQTTGPTPTGTDLINQYFSRLLRTAWTDGKVADVFHRVIIMEEQPTSLFRPRLVESSHAKYLNHVLNPFSISRTLIWICK